MCNLLTSLEVYEGLLHSSMAHSNAYINWDTGGEKKKKQKTPKQPLQDI